MAGSPRRHGNTETLLDAAVRGVEDAGCRVVRVNLSALRINPCRGCDACFKDGSCVQADEMQDVYPHLVRAAGVMLAAPIFSMNINAQSKAMIDRCQRFWAMKYVLGLEVVEPERRAARKGMFFSVCGREDPRIFDCTVPTISYFFHVIGVGRWDRLNYPGVDAKGAIKEHPEALNEAYGAGRELAQDLVKGT
ncbi:MAG: flavodoxin family protein [Candidatus Geothermincolia bacterium]